MRRSRFCPKHRQQQAVIRAQVKQHITSGKLDKASSSAVSKQSSAQMHQGRQQQLKAKSPPPKVHSPLTKKPSAKVYKPLTKGSPRKLAPLTAVACKPSLAVSHVASSAATMHSRRDSPSVYARHDVLPKAEFEHKSPTKTRNSVNDEDSAEKAPKMLKEYRYWSFFLLFVDFK